MEVTTSPVITGLTFYTLPYLEASHQVQPTLKLIKITFPHRKVLASLGPVRSLYTNAMHTRHTTDLHIQSQIIEMYTELLSEEVNFAKMALVTTL